ncbi:MAG: DUF4399 domain-containing protein [Myxococcota bacterium]
MTRLPLSLIILAAGLAAIACEKSEDPGGQATATKVEAAPAAEEPAGPVSLPAPEGAKVSFENLKEGDKVTSPVKVCIATEGLELEPSGPVNAGKGHHHILVDIPVPDDLTKDIPKDAQNIHLGDGSACADVTLSPGPHSLRLLFADGSHRPYTPPITAEINITVVEAKPKPAAAAPVKAAIPPAVQLKPNMRAIPKQVLGAPKAGAKATVIPGTKKVIINPKGVSPKPKVVVKPKVDAKPKVVVKPKVDAKPKVVVKPKPKVVVKPKPKVVVKPQVKKKPKVIVKPKVSE